MGRKFTLKCHIIHCRTRIEYSLTSARLKIVRFYARCINFQADSALDFITQFTEWLVNEGLKLVPEDSYLLNILDEIQALAYSIKYKIETLK